MPALRRCIRRFACCLCFTVATSGASALAVEGVRLNQIQVIGTHNSYHIAPSPPMLAFMALARPQDAAAIDYTHRPLAEQFSELGVRQIELDIFADPQGGLYAQPLATKMAPGVAPPSDPAGLLRKPGIKVLHLQDVDFLTTVLTFKEALKQIKAWSDANPTHCPIMVLVEAKQDAPDARLTQPYPFDAEQLDGIDSEILSVFERDRVLTPDDVRGDYGTLREAVLTRGWPLLDDVRGKVMFALDNTGPLRSAYLRGHPALRGRLLFVSVDEDHPAAAFMKLNNASGDFDRIQQMVRRGFLVRTRADSDTRESRSNNTSTREKALASGAHFVSTDYPEPDTRLSDYRVRFDGGIVARANPVTGRPDLQGRDLER